MLYPDQQQVVVDFKHWLFESEQHIAGLWAAGGYGKTYVVQALLKILAATDYPVVLTSMTNVAVSVLSGMVGKPATTLHSAFGWFLEESTETGKVEIQEPNKSPIKEGSFILVDEAGMVCPQVLKKLQEAAKTLNLRILFVGDHKQTFPVMEDDEKMCVPAYEIDAPKFVLTTPKRQAEGDIVFALCERLRRSVDGERMPKLKTIMQDNGKGVVDSDDFKEDLVSAISEAKASGKLHTVKALGFTNKCVIKLNQLIRKEVYGSPSFEPQPDEELVSNATIKEYDNDAGGDKIIIPNNGRVRVLSTTAGNEFDLSGWWTRVVREEDEEEYTVFVPESPMAKDKALKALAAEARQAKADGKSGVARYCWSNYFNILNKTADLRPTFALTVNKAQGSTFEHVFVDLNDIDICRDREQKARLAYTAVSRASNKVTVRGYLT